MQEQNRSDPGHRPDVPSMAYEEDLPFPDPDVGHPQQPAVSRRPGRQPLGRPRYRLPRRWQILISVAIALGFCIFWREVISAAMWVFGGIVLWLVTRGGYDRWKRENDYYAWERDEWDRINRR